MKKLTTEKIPVPGVGGKHYSLVTRDFHVGAEAAETWNWQHLKLV